MNAYIGGCYPLCALNKRIDKKITSRIGNTCDAGVTQIVIGPNGDIRPCVSYDFVIGNIFKDNLKELWKNSPFLKKLRRMENIPKKCIKCKHLSICRGGCRASAYNYYKKLNALHPLLILRK